MPPKFLAKATSALRGRRSPERSNSPKSNETGLNTPYVRFLLQRMWAAESEFSEARLQQVREQRTEGQYHFDQYDDGFMMNHIFTEGPVRFVYRGPVIDNEIHPIFKFTNTPLPMHEVSEQMAPALRLATQKITNPRALEWFSHVRYGTAGRSRSGRLVTLVRNPISTTPQALQAVERDLLRLAEVVNFQWFGPAMPFPRGVHGVTNTSLVKIVNKLEKVNERASRGVPQTLAQHHSAREAVTDAFCPTIWPDVAEFHQFIRHSNQSDYPACLKRLTDFRFALIITHELTHAWTAFCRPDIQVTFEEPLILQSDLYPEAGA